MVWCGVDDNYRPNLWYFGIFDCFLRHVESPTESLCNISNTLYTNSQYEVEEEVILETEGSHNLGEENLSEKIPSPIQHGAVKRRRIGEKNERLQFIKECRSASNKPPTEAESLGQLVATKMEKINCPMQRMFAESLLLKVLNFGVMGKLTEETDVL